MGFGTYGRTFTVLRDVIPCALGIRINGPGEPGPYTREAGALGYNEVYQTNYPTLSQKITSQSQEVTKIVKGLEKMGEEKL
jgi:hypothetical protein